LHVSRETYITFADIPGLKSREPLKFPEGA